MHSHLLRLLGQVHAPVGLGQELLRVRAVLDVHRFTHAHREQIFSAVPPSRLHGDLRELPDLGRDRIRRISGQHNDKLVATHARDIVVLAAVLAQSLGHGAKHFISFQVAESVVDLFETVQIAYQHG